MKLEDRVGQIDWYHTLELTPDVTTPGLFDLRPHVARYGLPERMDGMRALDIGTWDGFWAFEMERRGADVVALDIDDERDIDWAPRRHPERYVSGRGDGFRLAHEVIGSRVERVVMPVYAARPEELGDFDVVLCGSVLMHVRDQLLALERVAGLCRNLFISAEEYHRALSLLPFAVSRYRADRPDSHVFWLPNRRAWRRMMWTAGFDEVVQRGRVKLRSREGYSVSHVVLHALKSPGPNPP